MYKVFIDGKEGTTGLRIMERIGGQQTLSLLSLPEESRKDTSARRDMLHEADIAFLCLPDAAAKESVALAYDSRVRIIDASTAHRTAEGWAYGFAELSAQHRHAILSGDRVAVPGCHASGYIALVYPLVVSGLLAKDALLSCASLTGYSGGGKPMIAEYRGQGREGALDSPRHYATAQMHKHLPEMARQSGLDTAPVFHPIVADYYAGMLVSIPLHLCMLHKRGGLRMLQEVYEGHYQGQPLVEVLPLREENMFIPANAMAGKDGMRIFLAGNAERATLYALYDNLGKGASGAAIQCMNLMLGKEETTGLDV